MVSATAGTTGQFIQKVFDLLILFLGAKAVMDGNFTVGQLVAFRMLSGRVSGPVMPKIKGKIVFDKVHFRYDPQGS